MPTHVLAPQDTSMSTVNVNGSSAKAARQNIHVILMGHGVDMVVPKSENIAVSVLVTRLYATESVLLP